jgi:hypothetical protein
MPTPQLTTVFATPAKRHSIPSQDSLSPQDNQTADEEQADLAQITIQFLPNGDLTRLEQGSAQDMQTLYETVVTEDAKAVVAQVASMGKVARALELCEDIGMWIAWIRKMGWN